MLVRIAIEVFECSEAFSLVHKVIFELGKYVSELHPRQKRLDNVVGTTALMISECIPQARGYI